MSTESVTQPTEYKEAVTKEPSFLERHWQKIVAAVLWAILLGGYSWYYTTNDLTPQKALVEIIDLLQSPMGALVYIGLYALRPLFFFSAVALTLAGGAVFGGGGSVLAVAYAIGLTIVASNTSATIAYLIGRFFGKGLIKEDDEGTSIVRKYATRMRENSFETVLIMRFIFLPYDLVNYLSGILRIRYLPFITATILGSIPGTIAFVSFGASVDVADLAAGMTPEFNPWVLAFGAVIFVVSLAISRIFKRREAKREEG